MTKKKEADKTKNEEAKSAASSAHHAEKQAEADAEEAKESESEQEEHPNAETPDSASADAEEKPNFEPLPEDEIAELKEKLANAERLRLLALADMDNLRKRMSKEMDALRHHVTQDTVFPFLQVFDHFTMAVEASKQNGTLDSLQQGMEMIQKEFSKAFSDLDITVVDAVGKPFDPSLHEAVAEEHSDTVPAGTVLRQWSRGYRCGSKLLKPAMVVVSSGPDEEASGTNESKDKRK